MVRWPLEQINGSFIIYYYQDRTGSTVALANSSGADIATYTYDPYGIRAVYECGSFGGVTGQTYSYLDGDPINVFDPF